MGCAIARQPQPELCISVGYNVELLVSSSHQESMSLGQNPVWTQWRHLELPLSDGFPRFLELELLLSEWSQGLISRVITQLS